MYVKISLLFVFIVLTTFQNFVQCVKSDDEVLENSNSTYATKLLDSLNSCVSRESNQIDFGSCLKQKIRTMLEKAIRDKLDYVFTPEERSVLAEYKPTFRKVVRHIMMNDAENAPWLESKLFDQLRSLLDESNGGNDSEGKVFRYLRVFFCNRAFRFRFHLREVASFR